VLVIDQYLQILSISLMLMYVSNLAPIKFLFRTACACMFWFGKYKEGDEFTF
jgi:hypothetical protein